MPRRHAMPLLVALASALLAVISLGPAAATSAPIPHRVVTTVLEPPAGLRAAEPFIALDRQHPQDMYVASMVVPVASPAPGATARHALWHSADGGKTWDLVGPMGGTDNGPGGLAADPVVASGPHNQVVVAGLAVDIQPTGELALHAGTRLSSDAGRSFTAFGTAEQVSVPPPCLAGAASCDFLDKPWVAIDTTRSTYRGSVYLAWIHRQLPSGLEDLRFAVSRDAGRSYGPPLVLQHTSTADVLPTGFNENPQVAVRPDGTIDAVWNGVRDGVPYILHAVSTDGGRSFSGAERVVRLDPTASRLGIVPTLAVSPKGRLGLCWAQSVAADHYDPRVGCVVADRHGDWRGPQRLLPDNRDRQYLPATTFQGERLWVAAYVASSTKTTVVAVSMGKHDQAFQPPMTLQRWAVPFDRACPFPATPAICDPRFFIGDYVGAVATRHRVLVAAIEPVADPTVPSRVVVSSLSPP